MKDNSLIGEMKREYLVPALVDMDTAPLDLDLAESIRARTLNYDLNGRREMIQIDMARRAIVG
ncbi:hypothetical protein B7Z28_01110 [Candidatus Saccharibacteria bacterium 32-45-3]|nr:MAG: hypothetical protein B7Z28_01110 [Candidatus Saccharibacteria bacterium 32-45-3]